VNGLKKRFRTRATRPAALAAVVVMAVGGLVACRPGGGGGTTTTSRGPVTTVPGTGDYAATGPYAVTVTNANSTTTIYHPTTMGQGGTRHAVLLWGNGTFTSPSAYDALLRHLASHGFIVAAATTSNAGSGQEMLAGLNYLSTANGQPGGRFGGKVDLANVGTVGHSQGAIGALAAAKDARVKVVIPIMGAGAGLSASGKPTIYFVGQNDTTARPDAIEPAYAAGTGPTAFAELAGAGHLTALGDAGGFRSAVTAWARWQLTGDTTARGQFLGSGCALCNTQVWSRYLRNAQFNALG
jgi:pimeloyl-ACP methyl ester carboxylesterase